VYRDPVQSLVLRLSPSRLTRHAFLDQGEQEALLDAARTELSDARTALREAGHTAEQLRSDLVGYLVRHSVVFSPVLAVFVVYSMSVHAAVSLAVPCVLVVVVTNRGYLSGSGGSRHLIERCSHSAQ
jgi:hypothetical protein